MKSTKRRVPQSAPRQPRTSHRPGSALLRDRDTEARILEAARRVFVRKGTTGARVQDIAAEAGVNQALIHYYFRSKDALAERVFLDAARQLGAAFLAEPMPEQSLDAMIERFITGYIDAIRQAPFIPAYVLAEAHQVPERVDQLMQAAIGTVPAAVARSLLVRIEREIAARVAAGTMRPITPRQLLVHVLALCVFPFLARPVLGRALGLDDDGFQRFLDERRAELPRFVLNALRP